MIAATDTAAKGKTDALEWVTPDDFLVRLEPAHLGERLGAMLIDGAVLLFVSLILGLLALLVGVLLGVGGDGAGDLVLAGWILVHFFLWNGYWIWFEWRWAGMTPGKRIVGIQVIRPEQGVLTFSAVLTRGILREVEFWLPLTMLFMLRFGQMDGTSPFLWSFALCLVPLFNKGHRRLGDFLAGTFVVKRVPWPELPRDLARLRPVDPAARDAWTFTTPMLEVYGTTQLNALQEVLDGAAFANRALVTDIKNRVADKIGYPDPVPDAHAKAFLLAFYKAMREYLEGQLASGRSTLKTLKKSSTSARKRSRWARYLEPPE